MKLPGQDLNQIIDKYHTGTASPDERLLLEQWYEQLDITDGQAFQSAEQERQVQNELYAGLAAKMAAIAPVVALPPMPVKTMPGIRLKWISRVAAILLLMAGSTWLAQVIWRKQLLATSTASKSSNTNGHLRKDSPAMPPEMLTVGTGSAGKKKTGLPDGSVVWLNAGAVLQYPAHFTGASRDVYVTCGEVFFNVTKDEEHPFIVHTGSVATMVLGTSFVVKQSFEKNTLQISVKTGKVKVEKYNSTGGHALVARYLLPSDQLSFDTTANTYLLKQVSAQGIGAFIEGKLVYDDARLEEIAYDISAKYHIKISFENERLKQCHYRISFDNMALDDCLQVLSALTNTSIEKKDARHYIIKGESCN
jgi:ferric-dicitrate binding protein FerR (iron transport regulator)